MTHQAVGYIRISSADQNIARQLADIKLDKQFVDIISGSVKERTNLNACINYVRAGDMLYVDSIDRLARNLRDLQEILDSLINKGVTVQFVKENLKFTSTNDPMANLTLHIMGAFAEFERNMIRTRQREGIALAKKSGKPNGRPPMIDDAFKKKALKLKSEGNSIRKIALLMGVCRASIYKALGLTKKK